MFLFAVAALAAQHAQLAAATAVAVEASRRQSAPGCLQAAQDPLFSWLGNLQSPLASGYLPSSAPLNQPNPSLLLAEWVAHVSDPLGQGLYFFPVVIRSALRMPFA